MPAEQYAQRVDAWAARYPNHPASAINSGELQQQNQLASIATDQIALLLPLSGRFSEIGDAIKTGFVAARFADGGSNNVRIYDTASDTGTAIQKYEQAALEGASMIIGPAVIAADSPISQRLATAFEQEFNQAGQVMASETIAADGYDYSQQLTKMLDINSSYSRRRRLEQLLETDIEFEPAIRGDLEVIFVAVDSEQALLLRPQLQFHHAGGVPLLSTSQVFSGDVDADRDSDLTGIQYNDIPWTLTDSSENSALYSTINQTHQDSIPKLIALGVDAYNLHSQLENMRLDPTLSLSGKTGGLSLGEGNRIRRRLEWAQFQSGVPVKISGVLPVETVLPQVQGGL